VAKYVNTEIKPTFVCREQYYNFLLLIESIKTVDHWDRSTEAKSPRRFANERLCHCCHPFTRLRTYSHFHSILASLIKWIQEKEKEFIDKITYIGKAK